MFIYFVVDFGGSVCMWSFFFFFRRLSYSRARFYLLGGVRIFLWLFVFFSWCSVGGRELGVMAFFVERFLEFLL